MTPLHSIVSLAHEPYRLCHEKSNISDFSRHDSCEWCANDTDPAGDASFHIKSLHRPDLNPLTPRGATARSFYRSLPGCKASFAKWQATSHRITATRRYPKLAGGRCPLGTPDKGSALCTPGTHSGYNRPQRSTGSFRRPSPSR